MNRSTALKFIAILISSSLLLSACTSSVKPMYQKNLKAINTTLKQSAENNKKLASASDAKTLPPEIIHALTPKLTIHTDAQSTKPERFDISAKNVAAHAFFSGLFKGTIKAS
jgi:hypothetical protein